MYHPNVYADGGICLDILQKAWSPIYDVAAVLTSVQSLLSDPNPDSPANAEAARLYGENRRGSTATENRASLTAGSAGDAPAQAEETEEAEEEEEEEEEEEGGKR